MKAEVCRHCGEPILKFHFKEEGDQWWHANLRGSAPTYRRCWGDPKKPYAQP